MKKIILFYYCLFACLVQTKANQDWMESQITIKIEEQSLDSALVLLAKEAGYRFIFQENIVNKSTKINKSFDNKPIQEILDELLVNTGYSYVIFENWLIFHNKKEKYPVIIQDINSEHLTIKGKVLDVDGKGMWGAAIYLKGEIVGQDPAKAVTEKDGSFTFTINDSNALLIISGIGYLPKVVSVKDVGLIKLEPDWEMWNKVIRTCRAKDRQGASYQYKATPT